MRPERAVAEWTDAAAYAPLLAADRSILAWEWLRRDPAYRAAARTALEGFTPTHGGPRPETWGLHAFERPDLSAPQARPVWCAGVHPDVLPVLAAEGGPPPDRFDLARLGSLATIVGDASGCEHLLLSDGLRSVRIDVVAGSLGEGAVELRYLIGGLASAERPLRTLRRLLALCRTGRFSAALHPREAKADRFVLMLRAHDALTAGAGQREIAGALLSVEASEARWRVESPTLRSRVQRLVRGARAMAAGGYLSLVR
jgi:hypothetical protein